MKILIFGESGQLAQEFKRVHIAVPVLQLGRSKVDFLNPATIRRAIDEARPTHIINTAAYTLVDQAEEHRDLALQVNAEALSVIGESAKALGAFVFHFSTDYVFDGEKTTPYVETDLTNPINEYGYSKLMGELALLNSGCKQITLRISWVYSQFGQNFVKTILKRAESNKILKIVCDQVGVPTSASDVAESVVKLIFDRQLNDKSGLYHMAGTGPVTWHKYAEKIIEFAKEDPAKFSLITESLLPVSSQEYMTAAKRPKNSVLSSSKLKNTFGISLPPWEESLKEVLKSL